MKKTFFNLTVLILLPICLFAQTKIDTIYSTPDLDGAIYLYSISNQKEVHIGNSYIGIGDAANMVDSGYFLGRGYLDFNLTTFSTDIIIIEAALYVYQDNIMGNSNWGVYPIWDIPGGDTLFCMVDHITYGDKLDTLDWSAGDHGDYQTLQSKIGILSKDTTIEYKTMEVTDYVHNDLNCGRHKTQFRIAFDVQEPDYKAEDVIVFGSGELYPNNGAPYLVVRYETDTGIDDRSSTIPAKFRLYQNFPNPFNAASSFHYELHQKGIVSLKVFNVRGKEVKRLINKEQPAGSYDVTFDAGVLPGGIYFYRLILVTEEKKIFTACKKMILIK